MILSDLKLFQTMIIIIIVKKKKKRTVEIFLILCKIRIEPYLKFCVVFFVVVIHKLSEPSILLVQAQLQPEKSTQQPNQITTLSAYNM